MNKTFRICYLPESALQYREGWAVVAVDVIRATTMAVTAASLGWECYPVGSLQAAWELARNSNNPLLAGEIDGAEPEGFHMNNSPARLTAMIASSGPLILLSSSGTRLIVNARGCDVVYLSCFRNAASTADHLIREGHARIALIGAGSQGEFREEDQIGCAWIAAQLVRAGYVPEDHRSVRITMHWGDARAADCLGSKSVDYLRRTNQTADLKFILDHVDDLHDIFLVENDGRVVLRAEPVSSGRQVHRATSNPMLG